jgi:hypothetical protein
LRSRRSADVASAPRRKNREYHGAAKAATGERPVAARAAVASDGRIDIARRPPYVTPIVKGMGFPKTACPG